MIVLYTTLLSFLSALRFLVQWRASSLERRYSRVTVDVERLASDPMPRQGNTSRPDTCKWAKHQFALGKLVERRDRLEAKHYAWQSRADKLKKGIQNMQNWKGRKVPYVLGILDASAFLYVVNVAGLGTVDLTQLVETVQTLIAQ